MIDIGISEEHCKEIGQHLNLLLCNEYILYTKTLKYHWNVEGKHFDALHGFFRGQYEQLFQIIDDVAERARALRIKSYGTLAEFIKNTTIKESPTENPDELGMISSLLEDHRVIIKQIRDIVPIASNARDDGTVNFLGELLEKHEKMAWMLRAHLAK